jgi:hypothetical protein
MKTVFKVISPGKDGAYNSNITAKICQQSNLKGEIFENKDKILKVNQHYCYPFHARSAGDILELYTIPLQESIYIFVGIYNKYEDRILSRTLDHVLGRLEKYMESPELSKNDKKHLINMVKKEYNNVMKEIKRDMKKIERDKIKEIKYYRKMEKITKKLSVNTR